MELALAQASLADAAAHVDQVLTTLPARASRSAGQQAVASAALNSARRARAEFIERHAETVYDLLTDSRANSLRIDELVAAAADRFPGLVPTAGVLAEEQSRQQADKE